MNNIKIYSFFKKPFDNQDNVMIIDEDGDIPQKTSKLKESYLSDSKWPSFFYKCNDKHLPNLFVIQRKD